MNQSPHREHLPASIQQLLLLVEENKGNMDPGKAKELVLQARITFEDVAPWADFSHSLMDSYGRKLIYQGDCFELMLMSWVPGDVSAIHDHGTAQWGAVKSFGEAEHAVFVQEGKILRTCSRQAFPAGSVNAVTHDLIHQMGNVEATPFCSLHLYGTYDSQPTVTGDARIFDLWEKRIQYTDGGVFFCLPESQISHRGNEVYADYPTTLRHHAEMLKRIIRLLPCCNNTEVYQQKARMLCTELATLRERLPQEKARLSRGKGQSKDEEAWQLLLCEASVAESVLAEAHPLLL